MDEQQEEIFEKLDFSGRTIRFLGRLEIDSLDRLTKMSVKDLFLNFFDDKIFFINPPLNVFSSINRCYIRFLISQS